MVVARARPNFEGLCRQRREGREQGRPRHRPVRMQREVRRPPQAGRRLQLFRFHAKIGVSISPVPIRRPKSRSISTSNTPAILKISGAAASRRLRRQTAAIATAGIAEKRGRENPAGDRQHQQAANCRRATPAHQANWLSEACLLMRVAAAFRKHQRFEEGVVRRSLKQGRPAEAGTVRANPCGPSAIILSAHSDARPDLLNRQPRASPD